MITIKKCVEVTQSTADSKNSSRDKGHFQGSLINSNLITRLCCSDILQCKLFSTEAPKQLYPYCGFVLPRSAIGRIFGAFLFCFSSLKQFPAFMHWLVMVWFWAVTKEMSQELKTSSHRFHLPFGIPSGEGCGTGNAEKQTLNRKMSDSFNTRRMSSSLSCFIASSKTPRTCSFSFSVKLFFA